MTGELVGATVLVMLGLGANHWDQRTRFTALGTRMDLRFENVDHQLATLTTGLSEVRVDVSRVKTDHAVLESRYESVDDHEKRIRQLENHAPS